MLNRTIYYTPEQFGQNALSLDQMLLRLLLRQVSEPSRTSGHCDNEQVHFSSLSWNGLTLGEHSSSIHCPVTRPPTPLPHTWLFLALFTPLCKRKLFFLVPLVTLTDLLVDLPYGNNPQPYCASAPAPSQ